MDVDRRSITAASPAPSAQHGQAQVKRGARGPYKKTQGTTVSDELDAEGRMPGSKDGVGAFPPGSDWAKVMLALKLKGNSNANANIRILIALTGKRYRTKKERLRMEKAGLPYCPDGSLDYGESERAFTGSMVESKLIVISGRSLLYPFYLSTRTAFSTPSSGPLPSAIV